MKKLLFFCLLSISMLSMTAGSVDQQRARQIGENFLSTTVQSKAGINLQLVYSPTMRGEVEFYVFNVAGDNGFVVVAGDDRVKPILAYSTTGCFDPDDIADGFSFKLNEFSTEIQYVRTNNIEATADIRSEWSSVAETGYINKERKSRSVVGPLCQSLWNQNFPWNSQCPEDEEGSGGYVYAGCVATAMGQVMKFWNYPERGTGSYTYHPDGYAQQTANFGATDYHFELMPLVLDSTSTEEEYFYVAQLLHHLGISVDMQYSGHGSGAYSEDVPSALRNYFGYTCDDHLTNYYYWGWGYTNEEWIQILKDGGLDEGLPLYYSGSDENGAGGHAFVCDGYDENDYFHFNWGWSGRDDAWCAIGALNTTKYAFNVMNGFTGHIRPQSTEYFQRPENITDFQVVENEDISSVTISWTNPENNLNGEPLASFNVYVYRNGELVYEAEDSEKGQRMEIADNDLAAGIYKYSVIAENAYGFNQRAYASLLVGAKCDIVFELADAAGDGWKGAAISVTDENDNIIAVVTMEEGSEQTIVLPLLSQNLQFYWNHGWYHTSEGYDTDFECSFVVKNADDEVLYTSAELEDGLFLSYDNNCEGSNEAVSECSAGNVNLYPNPTDGILRIEGKGAMNISVLNVLGQKIMEAEALDNTIIDLSNCESGIYMIRIETENEIMTQKINVRK